MIVIIISVLSVSLTFMYAYLVLFVKKGWKSIHPFVNTNRIPTTKVSVLIAARNEAESIHLTIDDLLEQNYPKHLLQIIIVDDHSTDRTSEIISSYGSRGVTLLSLNESKQLNSYKKKAISEAMNIATGELIVATDADCQMGKNWLNTVVNFYEENGYNMISSPVAYFEEKNWFGKLQTLEFLALVGFGAGCIGNKFPSTCNGANLAYKREVFIKLVGFKGIDDLASGDDELFLHKVSKAYPGTIGFCKSSEAIVYTHPKLSLGEFISQRKRWASKSVKYKDKRITVLSIAVWLFNLSFLIIPLLGFFYPLLWSLILLSFLIKITVEYFYFFTICKFIKRPKLIFNLPILSILHIFYTVFIGIAGNTGKYKWKGRMVR